MKQMSLVALALLAGVIGTLWFVSEPDDQVLTTEAPLRPLSTDPPSSFTDPRDQNPGDVTDGIGDEISNRPTPPIDPPQPDVVEDAPVDRAVDASNPASENEVPILPGIELVGDMQMFHDSLESEPLDASWAIPMESEIYDYSFANSQELANNFSVPNVTCRTTICEIQAIGYGERSLEIWQEATEGLESQQWADEFIQVRVGGNPIGPDSEGLVVVFIRESGDSVVQTVSEAIAATR